MVLKRGNKGQVTIFIIIAVIIVAGVAGYFIFKDSLKKDVVSSSIDPIELSLLNCIEEKTNVGVSLLESQGGYIFEIDFEPGSSYMPFSSHLDFLGVQIPYWHYVSASNFKRENIPSKEFMEEELEKFLEENLGSCHFESYYDEGYSISKGIAEAKVKIRDDKIQVEMEMDFSVSRGEEGFVVKDHSVEVSSQLGLLYDDAVEFYNYEKDNLILENYSVDVLRLYAPVDGVEISCSPLIWNADEVFEDLKLGLQENILSLKNFGEKNDYFALDIPIDSDLRLLTLADWPMTLEVNPSEGNMLISEPVGNQQGLGILGFCYVPYHYVYNVRYPVLVQVYREEEIFQFPLAVIIDNNLPYESSSESISYEETPEICEFSNSLAEFSLYDTDLNLVDGRISFECFGDVCDLGETEGGILETLIPQCVNGNVIVDAEGFGKLTTTYTSVDNGSLIVILDKKYEKEIRLELSDSKSFDSAIISFVSEDLVETIVYPENKFVSLKEGNYEISVTVFSDSNLKFEETTQEQCVDVASGIGGVFGITKEECFDVVVPEQIITQVISGAGNSEYYFLENELGGFGKINLVAQDLGVPETLNDIEKNYALSDSMSLEVNIL